jgi:hypothetical protein
MFYVGKGNFFKEKVFLSPHPYPSKTFNKKNFNLIRKNTLDLYAY